MTATEQFTLTTRHGQRLVGLIDYPPGGAPVSRTLVLCHGYGGDKDGRYLRQIAATLNDAGDAVVRFDFTNGAGESDGTLRDASVAHYADDLDDVLDFVARQPRLAASAVSIGGHSYAGMVVLAVAARRPGLAAVFFLSAVYNRTTDFDMPAVVARITAPIVIISAGADREVASTQADALARDAGPKVIARAVVDGADHNFTAPGTAAQLADIIRDTLAGGMENGEWRMEKARDVAP
jgi:pimeloyl-ACP methyl ester carboxylesterase